MSTSFFTSVLFHMFSFIKNALFGSYSWMSHRTFIESSAVTTAFWLDQYGGRFASIFRRCPPSMFWGQCLQRAEICPVYCFYNENIGKKFLRYNTLNFVSEFRAKDLFYIYRVLKCVQCIAFLKRKYFSLGRYYLKIGLHQTPVYVTERFADSLCPVAS